MTYNAPNGRQSRCKGDAAYLCAELAQHPCAVRPRERTCEIDNRHAIERSFDLYSKPIRHGRILDRDRIGTAEYNEEITKRHRFKMQQLFCEIDAPCFLAMADPNEKFYAFAPW